MGALACWTGCRSTPKPATTKVYCAATDVVAGEVLAAKEVTVCVAPASFVTDSFIRVVDPDGKPVATPVGATTEIDLHPGNALLYSFVWQKQFTLSKAIPNKGRAYAIKVAPENAVGLNIRPNDHVDVLVTQRDSGETRTLLRNIVVLAVGETSGMSVIPPGKWPDYETVVLLLLPEEVQQVAVATATAKISLSLRNPDDLDVVPLAPSDVDSLSKSDCDFDPRLPGCPPLPTHQPWKQVVY